MRKCGKGFLCAGLCLLVLFAIWTILIQAIDVRPAGETGTEIGFATFNCRFHQMTGIHRSLYLITDWMGLVPVMVCPVFGWIGFCQLIRRKSLLKVDLDLIYLGMYYGLVIVGYIIFEVIPINYRPILIDGAAEASYPSSTTLLVLSVMPTLVFQADRRLRKAKVKKLIGILTMAFSAFMVSGRMISGVHWVTDIIGAVLLSSGLFFVYKAVVLLTRNLTQEELAEALYVSRTAVSKWESGRGYPSIDSLKEISRYFSVTIDDLLSAEKVISIAEREHKSKIQNIFDLLFGMTDICSFILIALPLYPRTENGYVYSVNLPEYAETTVIFLALAGETYAVTMAFLLLIFKGLLLFKYENTH